MNAKYTVYKTTNIISGKTYIGMHKTKNPGDSYLGSGFQLKQAIEKYGRANFKKEVLAVFETDREARNLERELVCADWVSEVSNYNLALGGGGHGGRQSTEARAAISERNRLLKKGNQYRKGVKHTQAAKDAVSRANKGRKQNLSDDERLRRSQSLAEYNLSDIGRAKSSQTAKGNRHRLGKKNTEAQNIKIGLGNKGKIRSEEVKRRISETLKAKPKKLLYTDGVSEIRYQEGCQPLGFYRPQRFVPGTPKPET